MHKRLTGTYLEKTHRTSWFPNLPEDPLEAPLKRSRLTGDVTKRALATHLVNQSAAFS